MNNKISLNCSRFDKSEYLLVHRTHLILLFMTSHVIYRTFWLDLMSTIVGFLMLSNHLSLNRSPLRMQLNTIYS